ncbi:IS110 family transposase [Sinorhizobium meliloti]|uniref:IS110 family transposase n=1 Tax=Rhizobium meliloti TaxID=382 RepID=UPI001F21A080|nr:IS110 family transposase [Sinorhizobium meliloti]
MLAAATSLRALRQSRFKSPQKLVSYFGLNPRVRQSGLAAARYGRISKIGPAMRRPCWWRQHGRQQKRRGRCTPSSSESEPDAATRVAVVAVARKLTVLVWHMLTKQADYFLARPSLVAHKMRVMELQTGKAQKKGNKPGPAHAYNVEKLRDQERRVAEQAQRGYERFVETWRPRPPDEKARGRLNPARLE